MATKKQVALVGDRGCGKTSLAVRLSTGIFLDYYIPTQLVDDFTAEVDARKGTCKLTLLDLSGSCDDNTIRSLVYENCDAVVVCFDLADHASLNNVTEKWLPELETMCPGVPFILAGCKQDETCDCEGTCPRLTSTRDSVRDLLINTRAKAYVEISSKYKDGMDELAELVVEVAQKKRTAAKKLVEAIKGSRLLKKLALV